MPPGGLRVDEPADALLHEGTQMKQRKHLLVLSLCKKKKKHQKTLVPTFRPSLTLPVPEAVSLHLCSPASCSHRLCPPLGLGLPPLLGVSIGRSHLQVGGSSSEMPLGLLDRDKGHLCNDSIPLLGRSPSPVRPGTTQGALWTG